MQDLLSGRVRFSEVLVNRLLTEITNGTEFEGAFSVGLIGEDTVNIKLTKPIYSIHAVNLRLERVSHDSEETTVQFRVGEVVSDNILAKPMVHVLKSKVLSWLVQKSGAKRLPKGMGIEVNGDQIRVEMRQMLRSTALGEIQLPAVGNVLETVRLSEVQVLQGEIVIDISLKSSR